jgi:hypothetical protein
VRAQTSGPGQTYSVEASCLGFPHRDAGRLACPAFHHHHDASIPRPLLEDGELLLLELPQGLVDALGPKPGEPAQSRMHELAGYPP